MDCILSDSRLNDFLAAHPDMTLQISKENSECYVELDFGSDRPFRDLIAEIGGHAIHELLYINKVAMLAKIENVLASSLNRKSAVSFFDVFEQVASENKRKILEAGSADV